MRDFEFLEPGSLAEALNILADSEDEACIYAGGTALLLAMRQRMLMPDVVVSLGKLHDLRAITFSPEQGLRIGALARHCDIARSEVVRAHYPMLAHVAARLANPQVRNQGTIGGNLCYADPATDPPSCLIALGAEVTIAAPEGERRISMQAFCVDFFTTALEPGEILTAIHLPPPQPDAVGVYRRHLRTAAEHRPVANVALTARKKGAVLEGCQLIVGAATPIPQIMTRAAARLNGQAITPALADEVAGLVAQDIVPISDGRGDAAFRRQIARATVRRAVAEAGGLDWREEAP